MLKGYLSQFEDIITSNRVKLTELYNQKEAEINSLLPGATTAGLAKAYMEEKHNIQKSITFWNWAFGISVVVFVVVFGGYFYISLQEDFSYVSFLKSLPLWIFSGFFTYYSTKQIAEYKRLASEYAHKEALNKNYNGYEDEINKTENQELRNKLLEIMLDSAKLNPSNMLGNKGKIPSLSAIEKMLDTVRNLYNRIGKKLNEPSH